jgi:hypothetical protein
MHPYRVSIAFLGSPWGALDVEVSDPEIDAHTRKGSARTPPRQLIFAARFGISLVIDLFAERQIAPPTTAAEFHSALARQHPRLFAAHADLHKVGPSTSIHREAAVIFRGTRCLSCETIVARPSELIDRLCADCRRETLL